jgi:hypothetical protein
MNEAIKEILDEITENGTKYLSKAKLNEFAIQICNLQIQNIVGELESIHYMSSYHVGNYSQNVAEEIY